MSEKVVITGIGLVSPLSHEVDDFCYKLSQGDTSVSEDTLKKYSLKTKQFSFLQDIPNYEPKNVNHKLLSNITHLSLKATKKAFTMSDINTFSLNHRWGITLGSGFLNIHDIYPTIEEYIKNEKKPHPMSIPKYMGHATSSLISLEFLLGGVSKTNTNACAASLIALREAFHLIQNGSHDLMVVSGVDLTSNPIIISSWESLRALSSLNINEAINPFHKDRNGFLLGEGSCSLILESSSHAKKRKAKILASIKSVEQNSSAYDIVKTHPETEEIVMRNTLKSAGLSKKDIQMISYHATGTKLSAYTEYTSLKNIFGEEFKNIHTSAIKSNIGHTIGASGLFSIVAAIGAINHDYLYPIKTLHEGNIDEEFTSLNYTNKPNSANINNVLINSFAFGGINSSCVISKYKS